MRQSSLEQCIPRAVLPNRIKLTLAKQEDHSADQNEESVF